VNLVDAGIVIVIGLGIFIGWKNGLIGPLLGEGTFLVSYWIIQTHPGITNTLVPAGVPRPLAPFVLPVALGLIVGFVGRIVFRTMFRLPFTRQVDKVLGAAANGALAFVIVYVALVGLAKAGTVLNPLGQLGQTGLLQSPQIAMMQTLLAQNPQAASMVPSGELGQLSNVASLHAVPLAQLGQYAGVINYYEQTLRPQLATSQLAPLVLRFGAHLPIIGGHVTLPTK
jgi:uncharacterized membrane protein required for colicin V production